MSWVRALRLVALAIAVVCLGVSFWLREAPTAVVWVALPAVIGAPGVWRGRALPATLALLGGGALAGAAVLRGHAPGLAAAALLALLWQWDLAALAARHTPYAAAPLDARLLRIHLLTLGATSAVAAALVAAAVFWRPTVGVWGAFLAGLFLLAGVAQTVRFLNRE